MGDGYEALLPVTEQLKEVPKEAREAKEGKATAYEAVAAKQGTMEQEMMELYLRIETLLKGIPRKVLQFTSSKTGEGVSTIVREYAWMAGSKLGVPVLIIDAGADAGGQREFFKVSNSRGWDEAVCKGEGFEESICRIGISNLYLTACCAGTEAAGRACTPGGIGGFLAYARERFELVIVDTPPATAITSAAFAPNVDGVIFVLEAENTRRPVVENARNRILSSGGNILGMVFNKRKNYIPDSIYALL